MLRIAHLYLLQAATEPGQDLYPPGCVLPMLLSFARAYNAFDKAGELANPGS
jgi:hypothetical protein